MPKPSRRLAETHVASWRFAYLGVFPQDYLDSLSVADRANGWEERLAMLRRQPETQARTWLVERDGMVLGFAYLMLVRVLGRLALIVRFVVSAVM